MIEQQMYVYGIVMFLGGGLTILSAIGAILFEPKGVYNKWWLRGEKICKVMLAFGVFLLLAGSMGVVWA